MGKFHRTTRKLFKHRESGNTEKERKAARKLAHPEDTVKETTSVLRTPNYHLQVEQENQALRTAGGKDLRVDARPAKKRLSKAGRKDDGN
jgi:hypothetical protein